MGSDTVLSQIVKLVQDAQGSKAPIQRMADLISGYFVPAVLLIAICTFAGWYVLGPDPQLTHSFVSLVAVLIIACPCALGLATPTSIMVGTGKGAENGILVRSAEALETAHRLDTIIFDKTGTLTRGQALVDRCRSLDRASPRSRCFPWSPLLSEARSTRWARPSSAALEERGLELEEPRDFEAVPGQRHPSTGQWTSGSQ